MAQHKMVWLCGFQPQAGRS